MKRKLEKNKDTTLGFKKKYLKNQLKKNHIINIHCKYIIIRKFHGLLGKERKFEKLNNTEKSPYDN